MECTNPNLKSAHTAQIGQSAIGIGFVHSTDKYNRLTSITVLGLGNKKALMVDYKRKISCTCTSSSLH